MGDQENPIGWRFGPAPFELRLKDPVHLSTVERGGKAISLARREMAMLVLTVEHAGRDVTKDELVQKVWGGAAVQDGTLSATSIRLKKKLRDPVIEATYGVGQHLTWPVDPVGSIEELSAVYLTALFTKAELERQTMSDKEWDRKYASEIDKIRAALAWALANPLRRHIAIDLLGATALLFERLSLLPEARLYVDRLVPLIDGYTPAASAARFFLYAGSLWRDADRVRALSLFERSFAYCRKLKDSDHLATLLGKIGGTRLYLGKLDEAQTNLEDAVKKLSKTGRKKDLWNALNDLGLLYSIRNSPVDAKACFNQAIEIAESYKDTLRKYITVLNLGEMEFSIGAPDRAIFRCEEAARGLRSAPRAYRLMPIVNLATYYALQGDFAKSLSNMRDALSLSADGDGYWRRLALQACAFLSAHHGLQACAAQLLGFIDQEFSRSGEVRQKPERQLYDWLMRILQENLSADSVQEWLSEGAHWNEARAMEFVKSHILPALPAEKA